MYAEFSEFLIRVAASFKAIHLHHHISELIKLPLYDFELSELFAVAFIPASRV